MKISALFLPYLPCLQGKSGLWNYLISHWPVSTGLSYSKCSLFCKFIQYMLVWSWTQAQSLAQDTTLSTRFQLPNVSTGIYHAHLKLTCAKQDSWSSPQILLLPSFLLGRSQDLAPSITWCSSQKPGSCLWHVPPLLYPNHHQHIPTCTVKTIPTTTLIKTFAMYQVLLWCI